MVRCWRDDQSPPGDTRRPKNEEASRRLMEGFDWGELSGFPVGRRVRAKEEIILPEDGVTIPKGTEGDILENYLQALPKEKDRRIHVGFDCDARHCVLARPSVLELI